MSLARASRGVVNIGRMHTAKLFSSSRPSRLDEMGSWQENAIRYLEDG